MRKGVCKMRSFGRRNSRKKKLKLWERIVKFVKWADSNAVWKPVIEFVLFAVKYIFFR